MDKVKAFFALPMVKFVIWAIVAIFLVAFAAAGILWIQPAPKPWKTLGFDESVHVVEAAALVVAAVQIVILYGLGRSEAKWRKLLSYHQFFSDCPARAHRHAMMTMMKTNNFDEVFQGAGSELNIAATNTIYSSPDKLQKIKLYLDGFEQLSSAIACRVVDEDYAFMSEGTRVVRAFTIFKPLIDKMQSDNPLAYIQFEELADLWQDRRDKEVSDIKLQQKKARRKRKRGTVAPD